MVAVDQHCAKHKLGKHCHDTQCVQAIAMVVAVGEGACSKTLDGFAAAQRSAGGALRQCEANNVGKCAYDAARDQLAEARTTSEDKSAFMHALNRDELGDAGKNK